MVRDGYYYALGATLVAAVIAWFATPVWVVVPLAFDAFFLWFFRDPQRVIPAQPGAIVSAADGKVTSIAQLEIDGHLQTRISVFLSVFDVHVNRSPIAGVIRNVEYRPGKFINAMRAESADVNEQNTLTIEGEGHRVILKQIAGVLARRIVSTKKPGDAVTRGERLGLIKFGSRTDVIFDADSDIRVRIGEHVRGGETVLAILHTAPQPASIAAGEHSARGGTS